MFTRKYRVHRLVWFQTFESVRNAIARETEIKAWRRKKKIELIIGNNRTWEDRRGLGQASPTHIYAAVKTAGSSRLYRPLKKSGCTKVGGSLAQLSLL